MKFDMFATGGQKSLIGLAYLFSVANFKPCSFYLMVRLTLLLTPTTSYSPPSVLINTI